MSFKKGNIKRMLAVICAFIVVSTFVISPAYATDGPDHSASYCVVTASSLNVRASADPNAEVITKLSMGKRVAIHYCVDGWVCVLLDDHTQGFVSDDYVVIHDGEIPDLSSEGTQAVVDLASQFLGVPYVYGGSSPSGFDCSGLVQYVYKQLGYDLHRVADSQMTNGIAIAKEDLAPGDIVGFYSSIGGSYVGHVGIYIGDGMMIHAPRTGDVVKITSIADDTYHGKRFAGGRRIIY